MIPHRLHLPICCAHGFSDVSQAEVIGYEPSKTSPRLVGALRCVMANGKEFKVGSG